MLLLNLLGVGGEGQRHFKLCIYFFEVGRDCLDRGLNLLGMLMTLSFGKGLSSQVLFRLNT